MDSCLMLESILICEQRRLLQFGSIQCAHNKKTMVCITKLFDLRFGMKCDVCYTTSAMLSSSRVTKVSLMDPHFGTNSYWVLNQKDALFLFFLLYDKPNKQVRSLHLQAFQNPSVEMVSENPIHIWSRKCFQEEVGDKS